MIIFQTQYDITTVGVELRKFKPIERRHRCIYKVCVATIILLDFAAITFAEIWQKRTIINEKNPDDEER